MKNLLSRHSTRNLFQLVVDHPPAEGIAGDAEDLGGLDLAPAAPPERLLDDLLFDQREVQVRSRRVADEAPQVRPANGRGFRGPCRRRPEGLAGRRGVLWRGVELQVVQRHPSGLAEDDRAFDQVSELPDIARKGMRPQRSHSLRGKPLDGPAHLTRIPVQEVLRQRQNVLPPLPQRRDPDSER